MAESTATLIALETYRITGDAEMAMAHFEHYRNVDLTLPTFRQLGSQA